MPTPERERLFRDAAQAHGLKVFEFECLEPTLRSQYEEVETAFYRIVKNRFRSRSRVPKYGITFGFIDDNTFNARAFTYNGDFVAFHVAVIPVLKNLFGLCTQIPQFLPGLTQLIEQEPSMRKYRMPDPHGILSRDLFTGLLRAPFFLDRDSMGAARSVIQSAMFHIAKDFLIFHEIAHLWNGHVDLVKKKSGIAAIDELDAAPSDKLGSLERQTLEYNADALAINNIILFYLFHYSELERQAALVSASLQLNIQRGSVGVNMFLVAFSIYIMWRLFAEQRWEISKYASKVHPPAMLRVHCIFATCASWLLAREEYHEKQKLQGAPDIDYLLTVASNAKVAAEKAFAYLTGSAPDYDIYMRALGAESAAYTQEMMKTWATLRPQLLPLMRAQDLAPAQDFPDDPA